MMYNYTVSWYNYTTNYGSSGMIINLTGYYSV